MESRVFVRKDGKSIKAMGALNTSPSGSWVSLYLPVFKGTFIYLPLTAKEIRYAFIITGYSRKYNSLAEFFDYTSRKNTALLMAEVF
jgi:hypothetical protein